MIYLFAQMDLCKLASSCSANSAKMAARTAFLIANTNLIYL